jgi:hypothetical protein
MRTLARLAVALVAAILLLGGGMFLLGEYGGEVVELHTTDASGTSFETRLWVVDDSGSTWLVAAAPNRAWLAHLRTRPEVHLVRGRDVLHYRAVPVETDEARQRIFWLAARRYGMAFEALALIHHALLGHSPTEAVPIRLEPLEAGRGSARP